MEQVYSAGGQTLWRNRDTLLIRFAGGRNIAATSPQNGGLRAGMTGIFNHTIPDDIETPADLPGGSVERYMEITAGRLGLAPGTGAGLLTSAKMENAALETLRFRTLKVRAVITAGVDKNGVRAGDPASYYEEGGQFHCLGGTVNILLTISADLTPGALLKSVITATEAKTAAIQELLAPSCYSAGLATGSGTDGIIVAADPAAELKLTDAGGHSVLGELIGRTVKTGVKKALALETGLCPRRQMSVLERVKRYNVDLEYFLHRAATYQPLDAGQFRAKLAALLARPELVALASAVIHLQDQVRWGLVPEKAALDAALRMLSPGAARDGAVANRGHDSAIPLIDLLVDRFNKMVLEDKPAD